MGKTRGVHETTPELRNRLVGMYEAGLGLREIAAAVNCSVMKISILLPVTFHLAHAVLHRASSFQQRTVKRWLNRFDKEGTVETRERCGRKRATTAEQDEAIVRLATQTPITAAKAVLPALGLTCSVDTIRERLHKAGIHNWSPSRKYMQRIPLGLVLRLVVATFLNANILFVCHSVLSQRDRWCCYTTTCMETHWNAIREKKVFQRIG